MKYLRALAARITGLFPNRLREREIAALLVEGKTSKEVLDFNLWLSPFDVWTAAIIPVPTIATRGPGRTSGRPRWNSTMGGSMSSTNDGTSATVQMVTIKFGAHVFSQVNEYPPSIESSFKPLSSASLRLKLGCLLVSAGLSKHACDALAVQAQAEIIFPPGCLKLPSSMKAPSA